MAPHRWRHAGAFDDVLSLVDVDHALTGSGLRRPAVPAGPRRRRAAARRATRSRPAPAPPASTTSSTRVGCSTCSPTAPPSSSRACSAGGRPRRASAASSSWASAIRCRPTPISPLRAPRGWPPTTTPTTCSCCRSRGGKHWTVREPGGRHPAAAARVRPRGRRRAARAVRGRHAPRRRPLPAPGLRALGRRPAGRLAPPDDRHPRHDGARRAAPARRPSWRRCLLPPQPAPGLARRSRRRDRRGEVGDGRPRRLAGVGRRGGRRRDAGRALRRQPHPAARGAAARGRRPHRDRRRHAGRAAAASAVAALRVDESGRQLRLVLGDRVVVLPAPVEPAVRRLLDGTPIRSASSPTCSTAPAASCWCAASCARGPCAPLPDDG